MNADLRKYNRAKKKAYDASPARKAKRYAARRLWEKRNIEMGMCKCCTRPLKNSQFCEIHAQKAVEYSVKNRNTKLIKYRKYDRIRWAKRNYGKLWEHQLLLLEISDEIAKQAYC